ncbi:MAG: contractile injection system tape measure protein, partial [Marinirhabdus sp.]
MGENHSIQKISYRAYTHAVEDPTVLTHNVETLHNKLLPKLEEKFDALLKKYSIETLQVEKIEVKTSAPSTRSQSEIVEKLVAKIERYIKNELLSLKSTTTENPEKKTPIKKGRETIAHKNSAQNAAQNGTPTVKKPVTRKGENPKTVPPVTNKTVAEAFFYFIKAGEFPWWHTSKKFFSNKEIGQVITSKNFAENFKKTIQLKN